MNTQNDAKSGVSGIPTYKTQRTRRQYKVVLLANGLKEIVWGGSRPKEERTGKPMLPEVWCEECGGWHEKNMALARHIGLYVNSPCPDHILKTVDKWKVRVT